MMTSDEDEHLQSLAQMAAALPNTPQDVIDIWLATHCRRFGWPPTPDNGWKYILGRDNDLKWLQQLRWSNKNIALTLNDLTQQGHYVVTGLFRTHVLKERTEFSAMSDGLERFNRCCDYLKEYGTFPRPIVLAQTHNGYDILDGNHRATAFFYLYGFFEIENDETPDLGVREEQDVWIAESTSSQLFYA